MCHCHGKRNAAETDYYRPKQSGGGLEIDKELSRLMQVLKANGLMALGKCEFSIR